MNSTWVILDTTDIHVQQDILILVFDSKNDFSTRYTIWSAIKDMSAFH